jgi:hypothetical protein
MLSRTTECGKKMKVAVFRSGYYNARLVDKLKNEGFFAVEIQNPDLSDIYEHPDFVLAPELIRWLMPTPKTPEVWADSLQSVHHRSLLKRGLRIVQMHSDEVHVEVKPLTADDYRIWHERLYLPIIARKTGAILLWPDFETLSKREKVTPTGEVVDFQRIFIYDGDGAFIGGSLWYVSHPQSMLSISAAVFEQEAQRKYKLSIRLIKEAIRYANAHHLRWTSYGTDPNFYGVDLGTGLQSFKASTGMKPVLRKDGTLKLVKILDENLNQIRTAGAEPSVLVFTIGGCDLSERVTGYQRQPPKAQRDNLDLVWSLRHDLKPIRFIASPQPRDVVIPEEMILQDMVLTQRHTVPPGISEIGGTIPIKDVNRQNEKRAMHRNRR